VDAAFASVVRGPMKPTFFTTPQEFRTWLEKRHLRARELWVGFHKKSSGQASITWPEAVDGALCFGWIDGQRKGLDEVDYAIRFTPRKPGSIWSVANVKRVEALRAQRRMQPAGLEAFEAGAKDRSGIYSYEQRKVAELDETQLRKFQGNRKAWEFFQRNLHRTGRRPFGGSSPRRRRRRNSSASDSSLTIRSTDEPCTR